MVLLGAADVTSLGCSGLPVIARPKLGEVLLTGILCAIWWCFRTGIPVKVLRKESARIREERDTGIID